MKYKLLIIVITFLFITSCDFPEAGTIHSLNEVHNDSVEVYKYYYDSEGSYVFVSRFKSSPNVQTTTWIQQQGKTSVMRGNVIIYENDSIKIIKK